MPIVKDAFVFIVPILVLGLAMGLLVSPFLGLFILLPSLFFAYFFRDPERKAPNIPGSFVSPADGRVVEIAEVFEGEFFHERVLKVTIFLSIFDVHVNRSPIKGVVEEIRYKRGRFTSATRHHAGFYNEKNIIKIKGEGCKVLLKQIAGMIARRVVCWAKEGDLLFPGQRLGMIRFGSRVEVYLPLRTQLCVKVFDKVKGGESILGVLR